MTEREHYDAIVVGMGIAGASLAYSLGKRGKKVLAIERDLSMPDKVDASLTVGFACPANEPRALLEQIIGELLQPGGVERLTSLGMAECLEGIDSPPILGYAGTSRVACQGAATHGPARLAQSIHRMATRPWRCRIPR